MAIINLFIEQRDLNLRYIMQSKFWNTATINKLIDGNHPDNIIIRLMVGLVFLSEGIQKFLFPIADGVGRFARSIARLLF
jgi:hypothetical protein